MIAAICMWVHRNELDSGGCWLFHSFVLFHCVKPPVGGETGGETLLTDTRRILRSNANAEKLAMFGLASLEAEYYSPASGYFGGRWVQHKFISPHPITGELFYRTLCTFWINSQVILFWVKSG